MSTKIQLKGDSLKRQNDLINNYLASNNDVILSTMQLSDLGKSAFHGKNGGLGEIIAAIDAKLIGDDTNQKWILLIEDIDRITRLSAGLAIEALVKIINSGVDIVTLSDGQTYDKASLNGSGLYILAGQIQQAHQKSAKLSERLKASWKTKREKAKKGESIQRKAPWFISRNPDTNIFDIVTPENKAIVNKVFIDYVNGASLNDIVKDLKTFDSVKFKTYSPASLRLLLANKACIGLWNDSLIYPVTVEPSVFYSAANETKRRKLTSHGQGVRVNHVLSGLVVCGECGKFMSLRQQKHAATVIHCSTANKFKEKCKNTKVIPIQIANEFRELCQAPYIEKILNSQSVIEENKQQIELDGQLEEVETRLVKLNQRYDEQGEDFILDMMGDYNGKRKAIQAKLAGLTQKASNDIVSFADIKRHGLNLSNEPQLLNNLLKKIGFRIVALGNKLTVDNDVLEYLSVSNKTGYKIAINGQVEFMQKIQNTDLTFNESVVSGMTHKKPF
jgi:DNA invertase Pin-like site-specific DNA recombinase